jgi:hypothetical protein
MQFVDSVDENVEMLRTIIAALHPQHRNYAKHACVTIENTWNALIKDNPRNQAVALGAAFAVYLLAQRLGEAEEQGGSDKKLIQLLS